MKDGKIAIIGAGFVGMSLAYSMLNRGGIGELVLIDVNKEKTEGEAMDLSHGLPYAPQKMVIKAGDYEDCSDAEIAVISAGVAQKPGQTRLELLEINTKIVKEVTEKIMASGFHGIIIVATNPVDLMAYVAYKVSGLPKNKVIGSGTVLDTARLRYMIAEKIGVSSKNVHGYVIGEHGDSSFVPWKHVNVGCKSLRDVMQDNNLTEEDLSNIHQDVVNVAYEIIDKKSATYYGIGMALNRLTRAILDNENSILTVSTYLENGQYMQDDVYIGVPAIIGQDGVKDIIVLDLDEEEQNKLNSSCNMMKDMKKEVVDNILGI